MTNSLYFKIFYLQTILSAIVAFVSLYNLKKRDTSSRLIGFLFLCSFLSNTTTYIFIKFLNKNGNIIISIYWLTLVIIVTALYDLNTSKKYRRWFIVATCLFLILTSTNSLFIQKDGDEISYNMLAASFVIISYCLFYFYRLIAELPARQIQTLPMFWFTSAFLFYHSATLFLFAFRDYLIVVLKDDMITYWAFHNIVSILQHGIILIGLYYDIRYLKKIGTLPDVH